MIFKLICGYSFLLMGLTTSSAFVIKNPLHKVLDIVIAKLKNLFYLEPEVDMNMQELVNYYGYPLETLEVITEDNYILTTHRIPRGKNGQPADPNKLPVLILPSSFLTSESWVANIPKNCLPLLLADVGYDVWLANNRGNTFGRKHKTLTIHQAEFWNFSVDEMGYYDVAALIDDVINKTGKQQVYIIGQSLGGGLPFALLADRPEYNGKVREIYALSPVGNLDGCRGPINIARILGPPLLKLLQLLGIHDFAVPDWLSKKIQGLAIKYGDFFLKTETFLVLGPSPDSWNSTRTPVFSVHCHGGIGTRVLLHFAQLANNPGFRHYDFGKRKNMARYNQSKPKDYDLRKVTVPVHLYYATNDYAIGKANVDFLQKNVANAVSLSIAGNKWNHLSYFWGSDAGVFYNKVVASILKNSEQT